MTLPSTTRHARPRAREPRGHRRLRPAVDASGRGAAHRDRTGARVAVDAAGQSPPAAVVSCVQHPVHLLSCSCRKYTWLRESDSTAGATGQGRLPRLAARDARVVAAQPERGARPPDQEQHRERVRLQRHGDGDLPRQRERGGQGSSCPQHCSLVPWEPLGDYGPNTGDH